MGRFSLSSALLFATVVTSSAQAVAARPTNEAYRERVLERRNERPSEDPSRVTLRQLTSREARVLPGRDARVQKAVNFLKEDFGALFAERGPAKAFARRFGLATREEGVARRPALANSRVARSLRPVARATSTSRPALELRAAKLTSSVASTGVSFGQPGKSQSAEADFAGASAPVIETRRAVVHHRD